MPWQSADRTAFVFPGAGIEPTGYEREFYARHRDAMRPALEQTGQLLGRDLIAALDTDELGALGDRERQAFTFAFSLGMHAALGGRPPAFVAGHSLGVYAALTTAGALTLEAGFAVLAHAHRLVHAEAADRGCGLAAIAGLGSEDLERLARHNRLSNLEVVIRNNAASSVVAGARDQIERLLELAQAEGASRTLWLDRAVPYHHPGYLAPVAAKLAAFLETLAWRSPRCPLISTIDGSTLTDVAGLKAFTAANLATPIAWEQVLLRLAAAGVTTIVECGPGLTLTKMGRFTDAPLTYVNLRRLLRRAS